MTLPGLDALAFEGVALSAQVAEAVTSCTLQHTMDGAATATIQVEDPQRTLLKSGLFSTRLTCQVRGFSYELAQIRKNGSGLELTFEDLVVAELRRHDTPRKVEAGTMSRVGFAHVLLAETPWIQLIVSANAVEETAKVELARGQVATDSQQEQKEDTWTCLQRIFSEVGWRCFSNGTAIIVGYDETFTRATDPQVIEEGVGPTFVIDGDYDTGKTTATATVTYDSTSANIYAGRPVQVQDLGPYTGIWLASSVNEDISTIVATADLKRLEPQLPEPDPPAESGVLGSEGGAGTGASGSGVSAGQIKNDDGKYYWPTSGKISSPFGNRGGKKHEGIDIAGPKGQAVVAARAGTVTTVGKQQGYGNIVYITHANKDVTRYGHLDTITCRRGLVVAAGDKIGTLGATGNATGPNLHFEIRKNGTAVDPAPLLHNAGG